jgi:hypothetical protein
VRRPLDWPYLVRAAVRGGVAPLVYDRLKALCPEAVPPEALATLQERARAASARNLTLAAELLRLLKMFQDQGIATVSYKGPVLAASVYGNLALREFGDLDILVPQRDVFRARDLLISLGYQMERPLPASQEAVFLHVESELIAFQEERNVLVELHWAFTAKHYSLPIDPAPLWDRLQSVPLLGTMVRTFSPEDLLLHLCVSGAGHYWRKLKWVCDIAELVCHHPAIDWELVLRRANASGNRRMLLLGLLLAHDLLGASLPDGVSQRIRSDPSLRALASEVCAWLLRDTDSLPPLVRSTLFYIRANDRW